MVEPFTVTRPSVISSSALRRLATPACERIFWRRCSAIFSRRFWRSFFESRRCRLGDRIHNVFDKFQAPQLLELFERRQLRYVLQSELHQEFFGGLVQN